MVLDKLSGVLKKTTDKIANAVFLDKGMVDGIVKDLQRALIEADVNVGLVLELSKKIKKEALDERLKGVEKKEHLLKLLHDELIKILGKRKEIHLGKENRFMFVGLYGAGKCVHGDSNVQLSDGEVIKARDLYCRYSKKFVEDELEDGKMINVSNESILVSSFNPKTLKIENKKITHLWELGKKELFEIKLDNGNDYGIKVTPEHPFFVLRHGNVVKVRADEIKVSDYVAVPREIDIMGKSVNLFDDIKDLDLDVYLTPEEAKERILSRDRTLQEACKKLKYKRNYCKFTLNVKQGRVPIEFTEEGDFSNLKIKGKNDNKIIDFPIYLTSEFAEFLGYVVGDGHIDKKYVEISSEDPQVIDRMVELSRILFNISPRIKRDERTRVMYQIQLVSGTLVKIMEIFGLRPGKKGKKLKVPKQILLSNCDVVRSFIRAYFDCDSYPAKRKRNIEVTSESGELIRQINFLLNRFGIVSIISKKIINDIPYWRLMIKARYAEIYAEKIGYLIKEKRDKVGTYREIGEFQGAGNQDMIPIGKTLEALRMMLGFSIGEIQKDAVYSYGVYEKKGLISKGNLKKLVEYYLLRERGTFLKFLTDLNELDNIKEKYPNSFLNGVSKYFREGELIIEQGGQMLISEKGKQYLEFIQKNENLAEILIAQFMYLAESNVCWIPIKKFNKIENDDDVVYDLTVEDNHSFIADGFVVHNTTTIGKIAAYYAKRGNKVCAVGLDVHRPAAPEQLKQVCDKVNIECFIEPGEKDPVEIWKKFEKEIKKYNIVLIDTAGRDALDDELIREIKDVKKIVKPTESFLVMQADIGQAAKKQAQVFKESADVTGVIITRMDSTAKGGGALTACAETEVGVAFIGVGEKSGDLESFDPESFLSRMLGMGDLQVLMEKIESVMSKKDLDRQQKKLVEGKFTLRDVVEQIGAMEGMGSMDKIMEMIPGMGKVKEKIGEGALEGQQEKVKRWKHIVSSMTEEEIENPIILEKQTSRIQRIAHGAGCSTTDVRTLLKQYKMLNEMMKSQKDMMSGNLDQKTMMKMARKFGKKMKF